MWSRLHVTMCGEDSDLRGAGLTSHGCWGGPGWPSLVNLSPARTVNNVLTDFSAQGIEVVVCVRASMSRRHVGKEGRWERSLGGRSESLGTHRWERGEPLGSLARLWELVMTHGALGGSPRPRMRAHGWV